MDNDKFVYIENLLHALDEWFSDGNAALHGGALLLEGDETIAEAISNAHRMMGAPQESIEKIIPRSQRRRISFHALSGWSGWIGKRKIKRFANEEAARRWLSETN